MFGLKINPSQMCLWLKLTEEALERAADEKGEQLDRSEELSIITDPNKIVRPRQIYENLRKHGDVMVTKAKQSTVGHKNGDHDDNNWDNLVSAITPPCHAADR